MMNININMNMNNNNKKKRIVSEVKSPPFSKGGLIMGEFKKSDIYYVGLIRNGYNKYTFKPCL